MEMNLKAVGCEGVDGIHLSQVRIQLSVHMNTAMNLHGP
jgi:hypothetical protein